MLGAKQQPEASWPPQTEHSAASDSHVSHSWQHVEHELSGWHLGAAHSFPIVTAGIKANANAMTVER